MVMWFLGRETCDNTNSLLSDPAQLVLRSNQANEIDAGSAISLTCVAYGIPIPSISWNNRSTLLRNGSRVTIYEELLTEIGFTFVHSILQLCGAVEADTGQYSCFTNNALGNDTASFDLTVSSIPQDDGKQLYNLYLQVVWFCWLLRVIILIIREINVTPILNLIK